MLYESIAYTLMFSNAKRYLIFLVPLFIPRVFCKFFCPQKALYNSINKIAPTVSIVRDKEKCIGCKKCDNICPMSIEISTKDSINGSRDCIRCYKCVHKTGCPEKIGALSLKFFGKKVSVLKFTTISLAVYLVVTGIMLSLYPQLLGL